jgi:dienelactone hydrolase
MPVRRFFSALAVAAAICTAPAAASPPPQAGTGETTENGARISELTYRAGGSIAHAWLVKPVTESGPHPAVLFVHWLGDAATTNHTEFLADAEWLARRGCVSLLPDAPWAAPNWFETVRSPATDKADSIREVLALSRSLDILTATPNVDPQRIAYVGHDFGAMYGALLAGSDPRPSVYVFMTPTTTFAEWFLLDTKRPPPEVAAYERDLGGLDIPGSLQRATFRASLAQFAAHDAYVSSAKAAEFAAALPARDRTVATYDTDHALNVEAATRERRAWLAAQLGLGDF